MTIGLLQNLSAQVYPVQVVPTVISPYSSKLSDYSNAMVNRINLQLISTDVLMNRREVDLRVKIQGNGLSAQSRVLLTGARPIYLNGGEIQSLSSSELATYFRYDNLEGISSTQYSNPLPDGVYTICFQVFDKLTQKVLSTSGCSTMYLMLNDPPLLNIPSNKEEISTSDFPLVIFSWTPRQLNATNVSYRFELKELLDPTMDPTFAFEVSRPLYVEDDLRMTTLVYDINKPNLLPGKRYAWRVRAISTSGLGENSVFKNNGYSEVYSFTYSSTCSAPRFLLSEQQANNRVKIMWQGENSQQRYHVQYRKSGIQDAAWFDLYTVNTQSMLSNLEPGFTYEFRVGASCQQASYGVEPSFTYSSIQTFYLEAKNNSTTYNCGIVPDLKVTNQQPLGGLVINETFMAGDFPVKVLDVSGSHGVFSGRGYIVVPYLFDTRIAVEFLNIAINTDYQLMRGVVETTYDPNWEIVVDMDDYLKATINDLKEVFEKIKELEDNTIAVVSDYEKGKVQENDYKKQIEENGFLLKEYYDKIEEKLKQLETSDFIGEDELKELVSKNNESKLVNNDTTSKEAREYASQNSQNREHTISVLEEVARREQEYEQELAKLQQALKGAAITYINCKKCEESNEEGKGQGGVRGGIDSKMLYVDYKAPKKGKQYTTEQIACILLRIDEKGNVYLTSEKSETEAVSKEMQKLDPDLKKELSDAINKHGQKQGIYKGNSFIDVDLSKVKELNPCIDAAGIEDKDVNAVVSLLTQSRDQKIKEDLQYVSSQLRTNQTIEYYVDDHTVYQLGANGEINKIEKPLSNDDILKGKWTEATIDNTIRIGYTKDGKLEVKAIGIRSNLPLFKLNAGQEVSLEEISKRITASSNKLFREHNTTSVKQKGDKIKISPDGFADGDNFGIDGNRSLFKICSEGLGVVTTLLKTAEVEKKVYLSSSKPETVIHAPGLVTGSVEVGVQKVTDVTSLVTTVYDVATDEETRKELKTQFKEIKTQIGEDPKAFVPILGEVVLTVLTNNSSEDWAKTVDPNADTGERSHLATRGTGNAIVNAVAGVAIVKNLPEIGEKLGDAIKKVKNINANDLLTKGGKFIDDILEADYLKYVTRKNKQGKPPRTRLEWKEVRDYWLHDSPMARGNAFNKKAELNDWYRYNEVTLSNGKRVDGYTPPTDKKAGEIVSRKATNLDEIELSTFELYLKELKKKYPVGEPINAPKYGNDLKGQTLQGNHILEVPLRNKDLDNIDDFINLAKKTYNIELRFRPE